MLQIKQNYKMGNKQGNTDNTRNEIKNIFETYKISSASLVGRKIIEEYIEEKNIILSSTVYY